MIAFPLLALLAVAGADDRSFSSDRPLEAVDQPQSRRVVGTVEAGRVYPLLKTGGPARGWCKLQLPDAAGWVECNVGTTPPESTSKDGGFAYYVLSLSWSPAFCETKADRSPEQCGPGKRYGFIVHGLWPQHEKGWPENCSAGGAPDAKLADAMMDLMPSHALIAHEWEKHGTCSGLDAAGYFARVRAARGAVRIPARLDAPSAAVTSSLPEIERWFMDANPGLRPEMIAVECKRNVSEVRICLDKELHFRRCGTDVVDRCKGTTVFPPSR